MKLLKKDFPIFKNKINGKDLVYLDNAATSQKPQCVIEALVKFYSQQNSNIHRGLYFLGEQATSLYEEARYKVAKFIGADDKNIVFTKNATEGINFIASWASETFLPGDEIVVSELEHMSNLLPWQEVARKKGFVLKIIPIKEDGTLDDFEFSPKTKLVAITHVSNFLGTENDIEKITKLAHMSGARVLIDAAQSAPHKKIDVNKIGCDFLVFSGHKALGPTGIGVLYMKEYITPYQFGGGMALEADFNKACLVGGPQKYEAGTPPIAEAVALGVAIDYLNEVDFGELKIHEASLCKRLIQGLNEIEGVSVLGPIEQLQQSGHIVSFVMDGLHSHDVVACLGNEGICVRGGYHCAMPLSKKLGMNPR